MITETANEKSETKIICGDSLKVLDKIPDGSVQLIITSPPYNIGKEYERDKKRSLEEYVDWLRPIIKKNVSKNIQYRKYLLASWKLYSKFRIVSTRLLFLSNIF